MQKSPPARKNEILISDLEFNVIKSNELNLGIIDLSNTRVSNKKFYVISPSTHNPYPSMGGVDFQPTFDAVENCPGKNIYLLGFSFDSSPLRPGKSSLPFSVSEDSRPPIGSRVDVVSGEVKRLWLTPRISKISATPSTLDAYLIVTNDGNIPSEPLTTTTDKDASFERRNDSCSNRQLTAGDSCSISIFFPKKPSKNEEFSWWLTSGSVDTKITMQWDGSGFSIFAGNR